MENRILTPLRIAFISLAMLSVLCNLVVPAILKAFNLDGGNPWKNCEFELVLSGFLTGLLISEFVAIGFWLLLDTMSVAMKIVAGFSLGLLLAASLIGGMQVWKGMPTSTGVFILVLGGLMPWAFVGTIFCLARLMDRSRTFSFEEHITSNRTVKAVWDRLSHVFDDHRRSSAFDHSLHYA